MVPFDDRRPTSIAPLDRVRKPVLHARVDVELADPARREFALDRRDERPHETATAIPGIDQHIQETRVALGPRRSRDREADQRRAVPGRHHHRIAVCGLPPHLALRERARAPLLALELQQARTKLAPGSGIERDRFDRSHH
jgi:hypothetical protein